ncbi:MFS family permease [Kroppenstedtia sanguinis]|uniref:MFS transporter n=1 Tax=Kroppenstedtia sanguinis TaxID=1380684 RepID=A0ABW4C7Z9_9BACL
MSEHTHAKGFRLLLAVIFVSGFSQGLLLPLLATLLEGRGVSAGLNGLNAAALYIGILVVSPLCGPLVRQWGYRRMIRTGMAAVALCIFLFPLFTGYFSWMFLRFLIGIGDGILGYASQLWITSESPRHLRGRRLAYFGLVHGLGFGAGPLGLNLLPLGVWVPFVTAGILLTLLWMLASQLQDVRPQIAATTGTGRLRRVYRWGFVALIPGFLYGFLEASLSGSFPVYGLREGLSPAWVSLLITAFVYGSLVLQVPLGVWSDRWGRKRVLTWIYFFGGLGIAAIPFAMGEQWLLLGLFAVAGGLLGSLYSLGLTFLADLLPKENLPDGNAVANVHFALGCMMGPYAGGWLIQFAGGGSLFWLIAFTLLLSSLVTALFGNRGQTEVSQQGEVA